MKIFLGGAVSVASHKQLEKYNAYKEILSGFGELTVPDDIWDYRQKCIDESPNEKKIEIDKKMVEYDLNLVKNTELMVCDISEQSTGLGIELGIAKENKIDVIFCYQKGSYVSNMLTGAFFDKVFIEYENIEDLKEKLLKSLSENLKQA